MLSIRVLMILVITLLVNSCTKEEDQNNVAIPFVEVNQRINVNDINYNQLNNIGGWVYLNAGSKGIIVFRESIDIVRAYERHCTYDPVEVCSQTDMNAATLQAGDFDCCGSIFGLPSNVVVQGPATRPLLEYNVDFDDPYITITN